MKKILFIMKKIAFIMIVIGSFALVACGSKDEGDNTPGDTTNSNETGNEENNEKNVEQETDNSKDSSEDTREEIEGYTFVYNNVPIPLNQKAAPILQDLGKEQSYFEAPSCAFQGLDKIYYYNGFELSTYPNQGVDYISAIDLMDDSVSTEEGVYIGSSLEDVIEAYGEGYTEENGMYTYILGETKLNFLIENNEVTAITYLAIVEGLE